MLLLLLSCSNSVEYVPKPRVRNKSQIIADSFLVNKILARANYINNIIKEKKLTVEEYKAEIKYDSSCSCTLYSFVWGFNLRNKYIYSIFLHYTSGITSNMIERQYYNNDKSIVYKDPDGNRVMIDLGLELYYEYDIHSFTDRSRTFVYSQYTIDSLINARGFQLLDNIREWDSLYDAKHIK